MRASLLLALAVGCSSSEPTASQPNDAGADTAPPDTRPPYDAGTIYPEIVCGPGPHVEYALEPIGQMIGELSKTQPLQKLRVSLSACPEVKGETDVEGYATLKLTVGQPVSVRFDGDGWLPTRWFEQTFEKHSAKPFFTLISAEAKSLLPGYSDSAGVVLVDVGAAASGTCRSPEGVKVSVVDHPEAVVTYHGATKPWGPMSGATETTSSGIVSISGVAPGAKLTLRGEKTGCDVAVLGAPGTVAIEAGVVSRAQLFVRDPHASCGPPPWVLLEGVLTERKPDASMGAGLGDVAVTFDACAGVVAKSRPDGVFQAWVSTNMPSTRRYEKAGYLVTLISEQAWPIDYGSLNFALRDEAVWKPLMTGFDATHAFAAIGVAGPTSGACADKSGVKIEVKNHPDAKVTYVDGEPPKATGGAATTKRGLVYVSGLTPGELKESDLVVTREGCTYSLKGSIDTGRVKLEAGAFTLATLYATPTP